MDEYILSYTAEEIDEKLSKVDVIQSQIGEVHTKQDLSDLFTFTGFINKQGQFIEYSEGLSTDYIPVQAGDVFIYSGAADLNGSCAVAEYDMNKTFVLGDPLVAASYHTERNIRYTVKTNGYARFSSFWSAMLIKTKEYDGITELKDKTIEYTVNTYSGYLDGGGGFVEMSDPYYICTDYIPALELDTFIVSCKSQWATRGACFYDSNKNYISLHLYNTDGSEYIADNEKVIAPAGTKYVRFGSIGSLTIKKYETLPLKHSDYMLYEYIKELQKGNVLYGKKYVACGDSFTQGPFSEKTDETWDDTLGVYKTYCWHIANRNCMTLVNEAQSGSTMYNNGTTNAFSVTRYTQVPTDADYITICFGLNETSAPIGTLEDTTNETVMGAWNIVLEYLITNMPYAKIGIIIPDAWVSTEIRNALISVAEYWGIPYLDLSGDPKVPLLISGRRNGPTLSSKAVQLRTAAFANSADDTHPNPKGHAYRSTIIENFMRSL